MKKLSRNVGFPASHVQKREFSFFFSLIFSDFHHPSHQPQHRFRHEPFHVLFNVFQQIWYGKVLGAFFQTFTELLTHGRQGSLIGNDSAPIHIATAVKTPTVTLFGPTKWECWYPRRKHDRVIAAEYPCRPCGHAKLNCPLGDEFCMSSISFESVWEAVNEILGARSN